MAKKKFDRKYYHLVAKYHRQMRNVKYAEKQLAKQKTKLSKIGKKIGCVKSG